jgi:hypothetical protein
LEERQFLAERIRGVNEIDLGKFRRRANFQDAREFALEKHCPSLRNVKFIHIYIYIYIYLFIYFFDGL